MLFPAPMQEAFKSAARVDPFAVEHTRTGRILFVMTKDVTVNFAMLRDPSPSEDALAG